jgi:Ca2+-transporting ATPase
MSAHPNTSTKLDRPPDAEPHRQSVAEVLSGFDTDAQSGLSDAVARQRLERFGRNALATEKPAPAWRKFLSQFTDILVLLLLVAALVSATLWLYERDSALPYEAMVIFTIVLLNAVMGYVQEARAEKALAALREMSAAHANVVRAGGRRSVPATELVPGDIVLLEEGDTIPADGRVIESTALQAKQRSPARVCRWQRTSRQSSARPPSATGLI